MSDLSPKALDALIPLRAYLATTAQNDAESAHRAAQAHADILLKQAEGERDRILSEAIDEGKRTAQAASDLRSARVRREANEVVLSQREAIRQRLRTTVEKTASALRTERRYSKLRTELVERGQALLGPDATIVEMPEGGILVKTGSRSLDLSLSTLATGALDEMTAEVSALWTR
ncbi:V-type ATP synthase subunit E family protein [Salinibacterium sp. TMP30]|uniref:V-type ATP synthase subunit E family protein n=1 Tax=Salinibacterium sp. TMP30 TaxID=3138237 RepID=UPI003139049A